ncbi:MAG TPA: hypothetical protein VK631_15240 [Solirubrobacteraceae bacterium]|nr:hypothetical protein [Solirubrobacteraceae bacterium]
MNLHGATRDLVDCLRFFNDEHKRMGLPALEHADLTWQERQHELDVRVNQVAAETHQFGRPSQGMLDALGAHVLACKLAVARAEELEVSAGDSGQLAA